MSGKVLFPRGTAKDLIAQLVGHGVEKHDDLMDALVMVLSEVVKADKASPPQTIPSVGKTYDEMYEEFERGSGGF